MIVNGVNVMTADERKEIIELLVKNGFLRDVLDSYTDKILSGVLREFRREEEDIKRRKHS